VSTKVQKVVTPAPSAKKPIAKPVSKSAQKQSKKSEFVPKKFAKIVAKISSAKEAKKTRSAVATAEKV
jgi:hypothetical protein